MMADSRVFGKVDGDRIGDQDTSTHWLHAEAFMAHESYVNTQNQRQAA